MRNRACGVSLIEIMVAVLIIAVGVLGIAGLQMASMQHNRGALFRVQALQLGNDMLDRIRANPGSRYAPVGMDELPTAAVSCVARQCDPQQMADFDVTHWKCMVNHIDADSADVFAACEALGFAAAEPASLPQGRGSVALADGVYTVAVDWLDGRADKRGRVTLRARVN